MTCFEKNDKSLSNVLNDTFKGKEEKFLNGIMG